MFEKLNTKLIHMMIKTNFGIERMVEVFLMLIAFWWAFVLLLPHATFSISATYIPMYFIMGENAWGIYFGMLGLTKWIGMRYDKRQVVMAGLMLSTVTWLFVGTLMLIGSVASTGAGTYLLISLLSASMYFYKGVEKR